MSIYWRVLRYLGPYKNRVALSILCSIGFSVFSGFSIYLTIPLLETLFHQSSQAPASSAAGPSLLPSWVLWLKVNLASAFQQMIFTSDLRESLLSICVVIVLAFLLKNLFSYLQSNLMTFVEQSLIRDLRDELYRHIHQLPLAYFTNERTGNLISHVMNDVTVVNSGVSATFYTLIREPLLVTGISGDHHLDQLAAHAHGVRRVPAGAAADCSGRQARARGKQARAGEDRRSYLCPA